MENIYQFDESNEMITPALIYYRDVIQENIQKAVKLAGGPDRLWPHVKTHKMEQMVRLQMEARITRFKCATISEAEMAARCGAAHVLLAYPLVGPSIRRFLQLAIAFPRVCFWAIGDDRQQLHLLGQAFWQAGKTVNVLVDVNLGMDRTGVPLRDTETFFTECGAYEGLRLKGLHCYDGHRTEPDYPERKRLANESAAQIKDVCSRLAEHGLAPEILVLGGSPSMPCYADFTDAHAKAYFSPGTYFVNDYGYSKKFPDLVFPPGAAILTRVISCPHKGRFTLDLGYKGIASDPQGIRGIIAGMSHVRELFQSEEHWAFCMEPGYEDECPRIGDELFVIPTHICPTSALYPYVTVVEKGHVCAVWDVTARNRKITY